MKVSRTPWEVLKEFTHARVAINRVGHAVTTEENLKFQLSHAQARDAIHQQARFAEMQEQLEKAGLEVLHIRSQAADRVAYLKRPDLGRSLHPSDAEHLQSLHPEPTDILIVIGDGLSATAVNEHAARVALKLVSALSSKGFSVAPVVLASQSRVALADSIGEMLQARLSIMLIGERPGLSSSDSLGAYLTFQPRMGRMDSERNCVSNINAKGLSDEAAIHSLVFLASSALRLQFSGVHLKDESSRHGLEEST
ncbi:ethanolamine ammonia-lyase subunit EutC [Deinococcus cellulosilyticus]|uniref:Ethanolamine ammonia-lyase small subunit n=1 Tax=Deinococcus cellulosilyticus (strain DSM 18568 / NBRC 106333 / KACC 11606 / 5516J-15) TaxID=1223518 RepID=A0A511N5U3_DEIC1|nr:ethanolamine ammonia-lyase subunit EutC [Deinococcus cellulosilyticus]GEM48229.1 ethanolamine ammonia-lyase light chain [Deinococcus cellulosilyticus NBRC 106333 = KACC 11606]